MVKYYRFAYEFMYYFSRISLLLLTVLLSPLCWFYSSGRRKECPPIRNPLLLHSATKLAHLIRTRQITCEEIMRAYVKRIKEVNKILKAVVEDRFSQALKEAIELDRNIVNSNKTAEEMEKDTPLLGVPITIKESIMVKGMSCNVGQVNSKYKCDTDSSTVLQIKNAGAIIMAVTNTPELCLFWETYNKVTGLTKNPYDTRCTVGGSSGGEAALISSGASLIGLGSDLAGSLRLPAFFTGIFSHKPTSKIISIDKCKPQILDKNIEDYLTNGPLTRYAVDLPLMMSVILKPEFKKSFVDCKKDYLKKLKVYVMEKENSALLAKNVDKSITKAMKAFAHYLRRQYDSHFEIVDIESLRYSFPLSLEVLLTLDKVESPFLDLNLNFQFWPEFIRYITFRSDFTLPILFYGFIKYLYNSFVNTPKTNIMKMKNDIKTDIEEILGDNGVLLYPTFTAPAHFHFSMFYKIMDFSYVSIFNVLGLPVTNCPAGFIDGMPIGFQIVARSHNDRLTISVAQEAEKFFGGWKPAGS